MEETPNIVPQEQVKTTTDRKGMATASLVLGILSACNLFFGWVPVLNFMFLVCGIVGLVLSILGLKSSKKGSAIAGLILSCVGIFAFIIWVVIIAAAVSSVANDVQDLNELNDLLDSLQQ